MQEICRKPSTGHGCYGVCPDVLCRASAPILSAAGDRDHLSHWNLPSQGSAPSQGMTEARVWLKGVARARPPSLHAEQCEWPSQAQSSSRGQQGALAVSSTGVCFFLCPVLPHPLAVGGASRKPSPARPLPAAVPLSSGLPGIRSKIVWFLVSTSSSTETHMPISNKMSPPEFCFPCLAPSLRYRWMAPQGPKEDVRRRREERRGRAPPHLANSHSGFLLRRPLPWDTIPDPSGWSQVSLPTHGSPSSRGLPPAQYQIPRIKISYVPAWFPLERQRHEGRAQVYLLTVFSRGLAKFLEPGTCVLQSLGRNQMAHSSKATEEGW